MKALFIFNDWTMDLSEYDVIICSHNYEPASLRHRHDIRPDAKLGAYVCAESIRAWPLGPDGGATPNQRITRRLAEPKLMLATEASSRNSAGFVEVAGADTYRAFSSYPWPKDDPSRANENRIDLAHTFHRAYEQAEAFAHEISADWDFFYVDNAFPTRPYLMERYHQHGVRGFDPDRRLFSSIRSEYVLRAMLRYLRGMRDEPIIGNTAGWTCPELDGICIEWRHQKPWKADGLSQLQVLGILNAQRQLCARNGRGVWSIDFAERFDAPGLAMSGVIHGDRPTEVGS